MRMLEIELSRAGRALVTGGGNGVGAAICRAFVDAGAFVWVNDIYEDRAAEVAAELGGDRARPAGEGRRDEPAQDPAHARGDRPGRHPREQRRHPDVGLRRAEDVRRHQSRGLGRRRCASTSARCSHVTHAYVGAMVEAGWGRVVTIVSDAGPQGRTHPGDLRRGEGRRDGLHARARRRGRRARRDRQLRRRSAR